MDDITEFPQMLGFDQGQMSRRGHGVVAHGDDRGLHVTIFDHPVKQGLASKKAGRSIYKTVPFISIISEGGKSDFQRAVNEEDKVRFPEHWAAYVRGAKMPVQGTPLEQWPQIDVGQVKTLKAADIYSVEQLEATPDTTIQQLGMGYQALKIQAANFLKAATDSSVVAGLTEENMQLKGRVESLEEKLEKVIQAAELKMQQAPQGSKRKKAAPAKEPEEQTFEEKLSAQIDKEDVE